MRDIAMEAVKLLIMILAAVWTYYIVPWLKARTENEKMSTVIDWAIQAVLAAEQVHHAAEGPERKAIVTRFLKQILEAKNISLSDEEIDTLIEAAVKQMNEAKAMRSE